MHRTRKSIIANIGGTFIYSKNPLRLAEWYRDHLGLEFEGSEENKAYYASLFYKDIQSGKKAYIAWSILENKNRPDLTEKVFCINYRINHLEKLVKQLIERGLEVNGPEEYPEGKFAWITDPDGNPVELWEDTTL